MSPLSALIRGGMIRPLVGAALAVVLVLVCVNVLPLLPQRSLAAASTGYLQHDKEQGLSASAQESEDASATNAIASAFNLVQDSIAVLVERQAKQHAAMLAMHDGGAPQAIGVDVKVSVYLENKTATRGASTQLARPTSTAPATPMVFEHIRSMVAPKLCLNVDHSRRTGITLYQCGLGALATQRFMLMGDSTIRQVARDRCLDASTNHHAILSWTCVPDNPHQQWDAVDTDTVNGPLGTRLRNRGSGLCLALGDLASTAIVTLEPCTNACHQRWHLAVYNNTAVDFMRSVPPTRDLSAPVRHVRVLCWVQTQPSAHHTFVVAINNTWGRDCDYLLFATTEDFPGVNVILTESGMVESRRTLWVKTMQAWVHVYENYLDKADWFFKIDDDGYANMHYLREFVADMDPEVPVSLGRKLMYGGSSLRDNIFLSGGCGQLLSRGATRRLGEAILNKFGSGPETLDSPSDLMTSRTLARVGVPVGSTLDEKERNTFLVIGIGEEHLLSPSQYVGKFWLFLYSNDTIAGPGCCSDRWIATHYVTVAEMYGWYNAHQSGCAANPDRFPYLQFDGSPRPAPAAPQPPEVTGAAAAAEMAPRSAREHGAKERSVPVPAAGARHERAGGPEQPALQEETEQRLLREHAEHEQGAHDAHDGWEAVAKDAQEQTAKGGDARVEHPHAIAPANAGASELSARAAANADAAAAAAAAHTTPAPPPQPRRSRMKRRRTRRPIPP